MTTSEPWVLQLCHGYDGPFLDCARQYAVLFEGSPFKVCTVFLTGTPSEEVRRDVASAEVIFLDRSTRSLRGLKLGAMQAVRTIAASRKFSFCIAHRFKPTYAALLGTGLPVIGVQHAFGGFRRRSRRLFANFYRKRLTLLGVSNAVRDDMRACLPGWPAERIETLYNRIDVAAVQAEQVSREAARAHLRLPQDAWVVGNVGRLHPDKDQVTLIRGFAQALPQLPDGSLLAIMGSGRLESLLKALAAELGVGDSVRFLSQVAQGRRYFKAFDVFALTSNHEPFGMVLLESMAAGLPLVCTDCGGAREVVEGCGDLFRLGDEQALAAYLSQFAGQDGAAVEAQHQAMSRLLDQRFSDVAARQRFWSLPGLPEVVRESRS